MSEGAFAFVLALISSGHIVDIALVFIVIEFGVLLARPSTMLTSQRVISLILALGPGACLMLAVRCALTDASPMWVAFWLAASLPLHLMDVMRRRI